MTKFKARSTRDHLLASTLLAGLVLAGPAVAQTVQSSGGTAGAPAQDSSPAAPVAPGSTATDSTVKEVVVTGSILRRKLSDTDAPITVLSAQDLDVRGVTTIADAVQTLSANGAATLPNSFSANGAFAAGASGVSLRGLTTAATLTLIDGMRTADYPLADDGERNFVDFNSIPDITVDRIETLKDGASSTYGADAIAGVVNVITKKTYEGLTVKAEDGVTQEGGGGSDNFQVLAGHGNLERDGYNVYVGVEYENDDALYNSQRGFPYNTSNLSSLCGTSLATGLQTCRANSIENGLQFNGSFSGVQPNGMPIATNVPVVAPYLNGVINGNYQLLNPAAGCGALAPVTITPANSGGAVGYSAPVNVCQQDNEKMYGMIAPEDTRISVSIRGTKELPNGAEAYFTGTYYRNDVLSRSFLSDPQNIQQIASPGPNGLYQNTQFIQLPVYICPTGVGCNASNGTLNPNNPFAAQGETAQIQYSFGTIPTYTENLSQSYRFATGVHGHFDFLGDWHYTVDLTASQTDLTNTYVGFLFGSALLNAINTGSYNFVNPTQNSKAELNAIAPTTVQNSTSQLGMIKTTLSRELYQLPGGPLQLGLIGELRYESIYNPSANSDINGADNRYLDINAFGTIGQRSSQAVAFEIDAPIVKQLDIDLAGRYDGYSTGEQGFSPKLGVRFQPIKQITFRSTLSQGFRAPSLTELYALPTTGFVTGQIPAASQAAFNAAHGNDGYGQNYNLGVTTEGTSGLKAERSDNFTVGFVVEPDNHVSVSFDYYYIKIKDVIEPANDTTAIANYYAGLALPAGFKVTPGAVDPNYPNALPTIGFLSEGYQNASQQIATGYDIGGTARYKLPYGVNFTSSFDGNYVLRLQTLYPGDTQSFAGTIGPYFDVSASGTPKFRANWQNTLSYGPATVSATVYFTQGYDLEAADFGDTPGLCTQNGASASSINAVYQDGVTPVRCKVAAFWDADTNATYKITKNIQLFLNVVNVFNKQAPYDPTTYGGYNYNPAWANDGIYGRMFKFGARAVF